MLDTAIILAGGFGTRLQSVVSDLPKPMAPVIGQPFLNYQLRFLKNFGIKNVVLSVGYLAEKITTYYNNNFEGLSIVYSKEDTPLGTGGAIRLAMEQCANQTVLVLNGDSFFDVPLNDFFSFHHQQNADASIALRHVNNAARYGSIIIDETERVVSFLEKKNEEKAGLINGGIYLINKNIYLNNTTANKNFSIETDFFQAQLNTRAIKGFPCEGYFIDIGIPDDYNRAQNDFKEFKYK